MDKLKTTAFCVLDGVKDSVVGMTALRYFIPQLQKQQPKYPVPPSSVLKQCTIFGVLFLTGILLFNYVIRNICIDYLSSFLEPEERESNLIAWFLTFLECIVGLFWTLPLFLISKILNFSWYQQIGKVAFDTTGKKQRNPVHFSYEMGDQIESTAIQMLFLLQAYLVYILPIPSFIQHILYHLHVSLLYALYSFEYKWILMGWGLQKRLNNINSKWPYFLGFGLPLAIVSSSFWTFSESICIFSTLFPVYVVSSTATIDSKIQQYSFPIKFFGPTAWIVNFIVVTVFSRVHRGR